MLYRDLTAKHGMKTRQCGGGVGASPHLCQGRARHGQHGRRAFAWRIDRSIARGGKIMKIKVLYIQYKRTFLGIDSNGKLKVSSETWGSAEELS